VCVCHVCEGVCMPCVCVRECLCVCLWVFMCVFCVAAGHYPATIHAQHHHYQHCAGAGIISPHNPPPRLFSGHIFVRVYTPYPYATPSGTTSIMCVCVCVCVWTSVPLSPAVCYCYGCMCVCVCPPRSWSVHALVCVCVGGIEGSLI